MLKVAAEHGGRSWNRNVVIAIVVIIAAEQSSRSWNRNVKCGDSDSGNNATTLN